MKTSITKRLLAMLLCLSMLLPNLTGLAAAADTGVSQSTQDKQEQWKPVVMTEEDCFPDYDTTGGSVSKLLTNDCGNGVSQDNAKSYFRMATNTNLTEFNAYLAKLTGEGFVMQSRTELAAATAGNNNISTRWLSPEKDYVLTVYFTPDYKEVKIVADTGENIVKDYAAGFSYEGGEAVTTPMMTMYGLSMAPNGYDYTTSKTEYNTNRRNCGALVVIRMPDNSLFVNDGGDLHQWSDEACAEFMDFCHKITGTEAGETVVFNTWFVSHAHSDHFYGLPRFIDKYHDEIDIKNVMYSLDDEMLGSTRDMTEVMHMVKAYYPEVKYYKPHTGEHFTINGIEFDVLYTQEDRFLPAADGSLSCGNVAKKERDGGTYRDFLQEATNEYDFNDTSTVLKVTFPKEVTGESQDYTSILYGDLNLGDQIMWETFDASVLATDIMMVPHHGHDAHPELVAMSGANIFLYTQHKQAIYGPDGDYTTVDADGTFRPNLRNLFLQMQEQDYDKDGNPDLYFNTTSTRKTYWEGNETAVIFFGENKSFAEAEALGLTRDSEDPVGFTVYTGAAPDFVYEGWTLLSDVVGSDSAQTDKVTTSTNTIRADAVTLNGDGTKNNILTAGQKYIIVHNKTNLVMNYNTLNGTEAPARPGSLIAGTRPNVDAGLADIYFRYASGTTYDDKLYFTQHMRDGILWEFSLTDMFDKDGDGNGTEDVTHTGYDPKFGGVAEEYFYRSHWFKGLSSEECYWYTDPANADTAWRYLVPSQGDGWLINNAAGKPTYNTRIEFFPATADNDGDDIVDGCDTCVIYYNSGNNDFRFLTVDAAGNWIQKTYTSVAAAKADLENLKLRLYQYKELTGASDIKTVDSVGPQTYTTYVGMDADTVLNSIASQLTVRDSYRRWMPIPCSGTTPKVGYYYIDGTINTGAPNKTTLTVKYRNDDGTDTVVTTLNLYVQDTLSTHFDVPQQGIAASNSGITGNVYENRGDDGVVEDSILVRVINTKDGYVREEVSINAGMLSYDADSTVTAPGGTAASAGVTGGLVNTDVEAGTVYSGLTLTYKGEVITDNFTLNVEEISQLDYPAYPQPGSVQVDKTGTPAGNSFFSTGIADVQLSATGISQVEGVDLIMILDMSGSMSSPVSVDKPDEVRLAALKAAMKEMMETLRESDVDFRVAISDFGDLDHFVFDGAVADDSIRERPFFDAGSGTDWNQEADAPFGSNYEYYNHLNYVFSQYGEDVYRYTKNDGTTQDWTINQYKANVPTEERVNWTRGEKVVDMDNRAEPFDRTITKWNKVHNRYTGSPEPAVYTGSGKANAEAFVNVESKTEAQWEALIDGFHQGEGYWFGTNYDRGLEYMYQLGYSIQQDNIDKGKNREVVAVFISDGAPMQYNYFSGRTTTPSWADWFSGRIDASKFQSTPFSAENKPAKLVELENAMLHALKTMTTVDGTVINGLNDPDSMIYAAGSAEKLQEDAGLAKILLDESTGVYSYPNEDNAFVRPIKTAGDLSSRMTAAKLEDYTGDVYFYLQVTDSMATFYGVMNANGIRMDERAFDLIAQANGIECDSANMTREEIAAVDAQLLALARDGVGGKVKYPHSVSRRISDPNATDLYASLEALLGYEITLNKIIEIAYRTSTVDMDGDGVKETSIRDMLPEIMAEVTALEDGNEWGTLSPYAYFYNEEGKNWWAEAVKGDTDKLYPVVNKYAYEDNTTGTYGDNAYYGTVRNHYDSGTGAAYDGKDYIAGYRGLGIPIYTLGVSIGGIGYISNEDTVAVLENISSGKSCAFSAYSQTDLTDVFAAITSSVTYAAKKAYYVDTMGDAYDLLTAPLNGVTPSIEVKEYALDANHNRTGSVITLEKVTFDGDGVAYSSAVYDSTTDDNEVPIISHPDIWLDNGVIHAKNFYYNTNTKGTNRDLNGNGTLSLEEGDVVDGVLFMDMSGDGVRDYELLPETFFWILGAVGNTEVVLDYPVYLVGSDPDDPAENPTAGDYPTNKSAVLYYVNYRNRPAEQETISPEFPWGKARVGYGFYLVDKEGNPIVNAFTGETGSFQNAIKLTRPAYQNLTWNEQLRENSISSASKASSVPTGYSLYVSNVTYYVSANADGSGQWNFQSDTTGTTYVQYGNTYTNTTISDGLNLTDGQTHDTVVWFAVMVNEGDLSTDKTVAKDGENFKLTLEAFANGETSLISDVAPADIVLVLDQSSSMYTPLGWTKDRVNLEDGDTNTSIKAALSDYAITDFVSQGNTAGSEVQENAKRMGYYIAVHNTANYMYLVHYAQVNGVWGWYYISLDQTTRSINLTTTDYVNAVNDSDRGSADYVLCTWAGELMPMMTYYKTQYGALVDSVSSFVEGLKDSGVEHRLGIVGFASPFYDGWKNYDGSGLYVDGNFYLYDTDFMYKGWKNDDGTYHYDTQTSGHIESTWTGASASNTYILDPNTSFLDTPNIQPLSSTVLQNAYANSIICKDSSGKPTGKTMYGEALVDVQTDYDGILASIDAINANYQQTCPSVGIEMAEEIFAARSAETSDRDKIVVLFTDGVPTVRLQSNRHHGYTNNINTKALYWSISGGVEDALDRANEAKANGVQIYTIGTASMQSSAIGGTNINSGDFLKYMSSDYKSVTFSAPTADMIQNDTSGQYATGFDVFVGDPDVSHTDPYNRTRYFTYYDATPDGSLTGDTWSYYYQVSPNEPDETGGYTQFASTGKGSDLNVAFGTVMNAITKPSVTLDAQDILKDVLSDYFDLLGDVDDIKVYTAPFNADGTTGTRVPLESAVVTLGKTDANSDRYDIINVTGYDYSEEYRSAQPREKDGADYYGSKLIVEIPIAVREGFWGGNNVPTNENISGVYEITGEGEKPITLLPIPQVNVPYTPFLTVQDKTVYYGDTNLSHDDLIGEVTVNGKPVTYENGKFVPSESWMDDYAAINWSTGSDNLTTDISSTAPDTYTYTAIFTPVNDGRQETEGGYSNIVGTPIDPNGESISAQGHVYVLVPVITFRDGYVDHFTTPDKTFFEEYNRVTDIAGSSTKNPGVLWQLMGSDQSVSYPAVDTTTEPTLTYTYTTDGTVGGDNPYQSDTRIQVSVNSSNDNATITDVVIFRWEDCDGKLHENGAHTIGEHMGSANIHEFWIHVLTMKDTVVIDFGLDVNVSLLSNDSFASSGNPTLVGLVTQIPATVPATFDTTAQGSFGTLKIQSNGVARYSLNKGEGLLMNTVETFYYVISYTANGEIGYYYGQVNIVPATIVYYEDNFIDFTVEDLTTGDITDGWTPVYTDPDKTDFSDVVQAEDRPGESLSGIDADNIYGKDDAYKTMQKYSMGSAMMVNVNANRTGRAEFDFWGTGFDVVSLTNGQTGTIMVRIYQLDENGAPISTNPYKVYMVNTYYGYAYEDGQWVVTENDSDTLYQVPVIKIDSLSYGYYKAVISASYSPLFDHGQYDDKSYDFYLDAIRVYNPAKDDVSLDIYVEDEEAWPVYDELRNMLIDAFTFDQLGEEDEVGGAIFIDGSKDGVTITDYVNCGPNNELYLQPGQAVAFTLNKTNAKAVHLAMKSVGGTAKVKVYNAAVDPKVDANCEIVESISSATDLYYDISKLNTHTVVIYNDGSTAEGSTDAILSITNIKSTYATKAEAEENTGKGISVNRTEMGSVLESLTEETVVLTPKYPSLTLEDEVSYNVYFTGENLDDVNPAEMGLLSWYTMPTTVSIATAEYVTEGVDRTGVSGMFVASSQSIPAKNLGDTLYFAVYAKLPNGSYVYSAVYSYSAVEYAKDRLANSTNDSMKALCVALLNYGAQAQQYFNYRTDSLMNAELTQEQQALVKSYEASMVKDLVSVSTQKQGTLVYNNGYSYRGPSVTMGGAFSINCYFAPSKPMDGDMKLYYWDMETYNSVETLKLENATGYVTMTKQSGSANYMGTYEGIAAKELDETVFLCGVYESDGVSYYTGVLPYSVGAYCVDRIQNGTAKMQTLAQAMAVYGYYAKEYFGA